ncbi:hypothetical protein GCM10010220_17450 [Streptomyces parvulus]|nr:hypothetical protein GCM10010220_17450 [Streptomyces parvulus]
MVLICGHSPTVSGSPQETGAPARHLTPPAVSSDLACFSSFAGGATNECAPANGSHIWYDDLKVSANRADLRELNGRT